MPRSTRSTSRPDAERRLRRGRRARRAAPTVAAAALAAVYLAWAPWSLDLAAAEYRSWLFGHAGLAIWDLQWYAGHHLPGYSVLFPPLGWWLGPRVVGALAAVAAAFLFERLAHGWRGERAWLGALWLGAGTATCLFTGRLTFALGLAVGLGAVVALARSERADTPRPRGGAGTVLPGGDGATPRQDGSDASWAWLAGAVALAGLTALASPVAALFVALAGTAHALAARRARGLAVAAAALAPVVAFAVAFPEGGSEPFVLSSFWPVIAFAAVALALLPRTERTLRIGVVLYALGCTAAFAIETPVGGNAVRLGALCAGPLMALALWPDRRRALALVALPLLWWQWTAAVDDVRTASGDPTVHAAFYAPLLAFLDRADGAGPPGRVEIPFTRLHWEARHVAPHHPLARGWQRQLDRKVNAVLYENPLTPAAYRAWLDRMAVRWVALPDTRFDYSAEQEVRLIRRGLPYLREVWRGGAWRVFEVRDPEPLVTAPARVTSMDTDAVTLSVPQPATVVLRTHWTPYWDVVAGDGCVMPAGDFTRVRVRRAGELRLATRFALGRIGSRAARCGA